MILIQNTVISDDIADKFFVCDLNKCKGACCIEGDLGAPLEDDELELMEAAYIAAKPYMTPRGIEEIERQGRYIKDHEGDFSTPTIDDKECAYAISDEQGILKCALEQAYLDGQSTFRKPISCHLYPIRITKYDSYDALNYERWNICNTACNHGRELGVPIYKFLKEPLIRKYGEAWYKELSEEIESEK